MTIASLVIATLVVGAPNGDRQPKVLIIGLDGVRSDLLQRLDTPNIDALASNGAATLSALNVNDGEEPEWNGHSATNWGAMLTGVTPDRNGIERNDDFDHVTMDDPGEGYDTGVRTIFGIAKAADPSIQTAVINTWGGIWTGVLIWSHTSVDFQHCEPEPPDNRVRDAANARMLADLLLGEAEGVSVDPDLTFLHLGQTDVHALSVGADGEIMPNTAERYANVDRLVGSVVDAVERRPTYAEEDWLIILTSDHGTLDSGEHAGTSPVERTIPLIVSGPAAEKSADIEGARIWDVAATALAHLGVDVSELKLDGAPVGLAALAR